VVWNLVMNAVKFTPRGGRVDVTVRYASDSVDIAVADTGEGISAEMLPHVFERFRQEDSSSTRAHGGLGLGLAIVRHLVELHGGHVRAESEGKGKGATFTVTLPLWSRSGSAAEVTAPESAGATAPRRLEGLRILVVDDDPDALHLSGMILRQDGGEVRTASSAFRAYDIVKSWHPQVLVADLAMPGEDGFMLLRSLRDVFSERGVHLPAIAVTAYSNAQTMNRDRNDGFDLYLTKPVDPRRLTAAVAEVVGRAN